MPRFRTCLDCPTLILVTRSRCSACESRRNRVRNSNSYYQTAEWRRLSKTVTECAYCGSTDRVAAHHLVARKQGGPDTPENLIGLCQRHHSQLEADLRSNRSTDLTRFVESIRPNQEGLFE